MNAPARAEYLREVGPQIGSVAEALLQALGVVGGLLRGRLPVVEINAQGHRASGYQSEFLPVPLDLDAVQRGAEVLCGLDECHPAAHMVGGFLGCAAGGGRVEAPPLVESEFSK